MLFLKNINLVYNRIPKPIVPPMNLFVKLAGDSLSIAIVSYAVNISMAKLFAKKHKYEINPDQVKY